MKITPIKAYQVWRGIYCAVFTVGNSLRHRRELFRQIDGVWTSGEAFPTGVCSSPLRQACPEISAMLNTAIQSEV